MSRTPLVVVGNTQASRVMPVVRLSRGVEETVTQSLKPSKLSAFPNLPCVLQLAPEMAPSCPLPVASAAPAPMPSSKPYAATGSIDGRYDTEKLIGKSFVFLLPAGSMHRT